MAQAKKYATEEELEELKNSPKFEQWVDEFEQFNEWLCPDISSLDLKSDPYQYSSGKQIVGIVNRCDIAEKVDNENGLKPAYSTEACLDDLSKDSIKWSIEQLKVTVKMVN